jgi:hypothetical protein
MPENEITSNAVPETAKEKFERERLSRRQALKRLGMTSAMATFALFSVDDLARMVGKAMQQRAADNKVAAQVAQEFQNAGIVMANGASGAYCQSNYNCGACPDSTSLGQCCGLNFTSPSNCCINATWPGTVQSCQNCCSDVTSYGRSGFNEESCKQSCSSFWIQNTA